MACIKINILGVLTDIHRKEVVHLFRKEISFLFMTVTSLASLSHIQTHYMKMSLKAIFEAYRAHCACLQCNITHNAIRQLILDAATLIGRLFSTL